MVQTLSIRTKLIMAMLALVASVALVGVTADAANADGVTEIRWVENHSPYYVYLQNWETKDYTVMRPRSTVFYSERVPWARDHVEFNQGHHIELGFRQRFTDAPNACFYLSTVCPELAIWQEAHNRPVYPGDFIRYSRYRDRYPQKYHHSFVYSSWAPRVPGESDSGGRRNLKIWASEHPTTGYAVMELSLVRP